MRRGWMALATLTAALIVTPSGPTRAADDEPNLELAYPLVTRRPVIERELELRIDHTKNRGGRETRVAPAVELPLLPRWQIEVSVPFLFTDPHDGPAMAGPGDVEIENKVLLFKSLEHRMLVAAGFEARLPTGSERRGLGGEASLEPFLTAGLALGRFDVLASVAYELNVNAHVHGEHEREVTASTAAVYWLTRRFAPLLEVTTVRLTHGHEEEGGPSLRGRTQIYLTPGFNAKLLPRTTLRLGLELPVTGAKKFDYALRGGMVREF